MKKFMKNSFQSKILSGFLALSMIFTLIPAPVSFAADTTFNPEGSFAPAVTPAKQQENQLAQGSQTPTPTGAFMPTAPLAPATSGGNNGGAKSAGSFLPTPNSSGTNKSSNSGNSGAANISSAGSPATGNGNPSGTPILPNGGNNGNPNPDLNPNPNPNPNDDPTDQQIDPDMTAINFPDFSPKMREEAYAELARLTNFPLSEIEGLITNTSWHMYHRILTFELKPGIMPTGRVLNVLGEPTLPRKIEIRFKPIDYITTPDATGSHTITLYEIFRVVLHFGNDFSASASRRTYLNYNKGRLEQIVRMEPDSKGGTYVSSTETHSYDSAGSLIKIIYKKGPLDASRVTEYHITFQTGAAVRGSLIKEITEIPFKTVSKFNYLISTPYCSPSTKPEDCLGKAALSRITRYDEGGNLLSTTDLIGGFNVTLANGNVESVNFIRWPTLEMILNLIRTLEGKPKDTGSGSNDQGSWLSGGMAAAKQKEKESIAAEVKALSAQLQQAQAKLEDILQQQKIASDALDAAVTISKAQLEALNAELLELSKNKNLDPVLLTAIKAFLAEMVWYLDPTTTSKGGPSNTQYSLAAEAAGEKITISRQGSPLKVKALIEAITAHLKNLDLYSEKVSAFQGTAEDFKRFLAGRPLFQAPILVGDDPWVTPKLSIQTKINDALKLKADAAKPASNTVITYDTQGRKIRSVITEHFPNGFDRNGQKVYFVVSDHRFDPPTGNETNAYFSYSNASNTIRLAYLGLTFALDGKTVTKSYEVIYSAVGIRLSEVYKYFNELGKMVRKWFAGYQRDGKKLSSVMDILYDAFGNRTSQLSTLYDTKGRRTESTKDSFYAGGDSISRSVRTWFDVLTQKIKEVIVTTTLVVTVERVIADEKLKIEELQRAYAIKEQAVDAEIQAFEAAVAKDVLALKDVSAKLLVLLDGTSLSDALRAEIRNFMAQTDPYLAAVGNEVEKYKAFLKSALSHTSTDLAAHVAYLSKLIEYSNQAKAAKDSELAFLAKKFPVWEPPVYILGMPAVDNPLIALQAMIKTGLELLSRATAPKPPATIYESLSAALTGIHKTTNVTLLGDVLTSTNAQGQKTQRVVYAVEQPSSNSARKAFLYFTATVTGFGKEWVFTEAPYGANWDESPKVRDPIIAHVLKQKDGALDVTYSITSADSDPTAPDTREVRFTRKNAKGYFIFGSTTVTRVKGENGHYSYSTMLMPVMV